MRVQAPASAVAKMREWNRRVPIGTAVYLIQRPGVAGVTASLAYLNEWNEPVVRLSFEKAPVGISAVRVLA